MKILLFQVALKKSEGNILENRSEAESLQPEKLFNGLDSWQPERLVLRPPFQNLSLNVNLYFEMQPWPPFAPLQSQDAVTIYSRLRFAHSRSGSAATNPLTEPAHNNGHKFSTGLRGFCRPRFRKRPKGYRYRGPTADTVEVPCNME